MAKEEKQPAGMAGEKQSAAGGEKEVDHSRFRKIETERYMYNADKCGGVALVGYAIDLLDMPPIKGRPWKAIVIKTTEPTKAMNRDKEVVSISVGQEVLIPATHQLAQHLSRAAGHPELTFELFIKPDKKLDIGGGQTMWLYDLRANPQPKGLSEVGAAMLKATKGLRQLPAAEVAGTQDADDIPF